MEEMIMLLNLVITDDSYPAQQPCQVLNDPGGISDRIADAAAFEFVQGDTVDLNKIQQLQSRCPGVKVTINHGNRQPSFIDTPKGRIFFFCG